MWDIKDNKDIEPCRFLMIKWCRLGDFAPYSYFFLFLNFSLHPNLSQRSSSMKVFSLCCLACYFDVTRPVDRSHLQSSWINFFIITRIFWYRACLGSHFGSIFVHLCDMTPSTVVITKPPTTTPQWAVHSLIVRPSCFCCSGCSLVRYCLIPLSSSIWGASFVLPPICESDNRLNRHQFFFRPTSRFLWWDGVSYSTKAPLHQPCCVSCWTFFGLLLFCSSFARFRFVFSSFYSSFCINFLQKCVFIAGCRLLKKIERLWRHQYWWWQRWKKYRHRTWLEIFRKLIEIDFRHGVN